MLIARALLSKIRSPRLSPRELQDQLDVTRAAVLTSAYAADRDAPLELHSRGEQLSSSPAIKPKCAARAKSFEKLEKEVSTLKPLARKRMTQLALNDQIVSYFNLVHAARMASPPPDVEGGTGDEGADQPTPSDGGSAASPEVVDRAVDEAVKRKSLEGWRRQLLRQMLRSELGFATVVKDSTISGAGLGLFIEGSAPAGAVIAIYPGFVHLPENLNNPKYAASLLPDEQHFLMGRADGTLIDGRTAGLLPSSPLTFAHAANHPPEGRTANVLQISYDFPALGETDVGIAKGGRFPERLRPFVPNRYHTRPKAFFGGKIDQSAMVETVVLIAGKAGLKDEEVFMDYRFNPNMPHPEWYFPVDPKETAKMWAADERDSAAQSLLSAPWFTRKD